jgi:hypothetical protein
MPGRDWALLAAGCILSGIAGAVLAAFWIAHGPALVRVLLAPFLVVIGLLLIVLSIVSWWRKVNLLRRGELARATIFAYEEVVTARAGDAFSSVSERWVDFKEGFEETHTRRAALNASGDLTPAVLRQRPVARCRFRFQPAGAEVVTAQAQLDFTGRLAAGKAHPTDIAVYHPEKPQRALLLSGFSPPLTVSDSGQWEQDKEKGSAFFAALWASAEQETGDATGP